MKKFFSLVLALVMALSLTTVAWGAQTVETVTTSTMTTQRVIDNGDDVVLTADSAVTITVDSANVDAFHVKTGGKLTIGANVTITGAGALIYVEGGELVIEGKVVATGATYGAICVVGDTAKVTVKNGATVSSAGNSAIGIETAANVGSSLTDGGTVNIEGGTVSTGAADTYAAVFGYTGTINVTGGTISSANTTPALLASSDNSTPATVTVSGGNVDSVGVYNAADADDVTITGGNFATAPTVPTGYEAVYSNGVYVVVATGALSGSGSTTTLKDTEKYDIYEITGTTSVKVADDADITKKVTGNKSVTQDGKTTTTYTATLYADDANVYVEVDVTAATHKLTKNGAIVAYLVNLANVGEIPVTTKVVDSYVAAVDEPDCGEYDKAVYAKGVYVIDKVPYAAGGANWAVLNGKFVNYGGVATAEPHTYKAATFSATKHTDVTTVKCTECKQTWNVLSVAQVATMAPASFKLVSVDVAGTPTNLYIAVAASAGTVVTPSTDKVQSAETFDAGIAMYVGMSVLAATGSAVVLKKKH